MQGIEICPATIALYIQASCLPEMRKDRVYNLCLAQINPMISPTLAVAVLRGWGQVVAVSTSTIDLVIFGNLAVHLNF